MVATENVKGVGRSGKILPSTTGLRPKIAGREICMAGHGMRFLPPIHAYYLSIDEMLSGWLFRSRKRPDDDMRNGGIRIGGTQYEEKLGRV